MMMVTCPRCQATSEYNPRPSTSQSKKKCEICGYKFSVSKEQSDSINNDGENDKGGSRMVLRSVNRIEDGLEKLARATERLVESQLKARADINEIKELQAEFALVAKTQAMMANNTQQEIIEIKKDIKTILRMLEER